MDILQGKLLQVIKKWYWMLEGEEVFCQIWRRSDGSIYKFKNSRLTNTRINLGRGLDPKDCIII
jgi:hypothetical protein